MILTDMTLEGIIRPIHELDYLSGSYFMYKYAESFCHFIAERYGEDKLQMLFENWWKARNFRALFKLTLGKSLEEVGSEWVYSLKKRHFPKLEEGDLPAKVSKPLTGKDFAVKPAPLTIDYRGAQDWIVYKANKLGYSGIYLRSPSTDQEITLVKGERSPAFESLHLLQSSIGASADGRIVFVSKRHERDVLYIYDVPAGRITGSYDFDRLYQLQSPSWSADGTKIVFTGVAYGGFHDLYLFSLADSSLLRLTDDVYFDGDAAFDRNGDIIFASDRGSYGYEGYTNLFRFNIADSTIVPLTFGRYNDRSPHTCKYGILLSSDRSGTSNVYLLTDEGELHQVTRFATGAFDPVLRGDELIFSAYQNFRFGVYSLEFDITQAVPVETEAPQFTVWNPPHLEGTLEEAVIDYTSEYSFDIAQSAISYDAVFGTIGGFQTVLSDMLGNHQLPAGCEYGEQQG